MAVHPFQDVDYLFAINKISMVIKDGGAGVAGGTPGAAGAPPLYNGTTFAIVKFPMIMNAPANFFKLLNLIDVNELQKDYPGEKIFVSRYSLTEAFRYDLIARFLIQIEAEDKTRMDPRFREKMWIKSPLYIPKNGEDNKISSLKGVSFETTYPISGESKRFPYRISNVAWLSPSKKFEFRPVVERLS